MLFECALFSHFIVRGHSWVFPSLTRKFLFDLRVSRRCAVQPLSVEIIIKKYIYIYICKVGLVMNRLGANAGASTMSSTKPNEAALLSTATSCWELRTLGTHLF
jgi:hypothetical protein